MDDSWKKDPFDPEGKGYDYESAEKYGIKKDPYTQHWPSRVPQTGLILKGRGHETWHLTEEGERRAGYEIYQGTDGRYYSRSLIDLDKQRFVDGLEQPSSHGAEHTKFLRKKVYRHDDSSFGKRYIEFEDGSTVFMKNLQDHATRFTVTRPTGGEEEKIFTEKIKMDFSFESDVYVAMIELAKDGKSVYDKDNVYGPDVKGFAIYAITGDGSQNLPFLGWTSNIGDTDKKDFGLVVTSFATEQERRTIRFGGHNVPCTILGAATVVNQLDRIDSHYYSYDEGYTAFESNAEVWTYEGYWIESEEDAYLIDDSTVSVDPGPPPESLCGYTWSFNDHFDETADYHDEEHLFYKIEVGVTCTAFWPPLNNQKIKYKTIIPICGWLWPTYLEEFGEDDAALWDLAESPDFYDEIGVRATEAGPYIMENSYWKYERGDWTDKRLWGNFWGSYLYPVTDRGADAFPYTSQPTATVASDYTVLEGPIRWWGANGAYYYHDFKKYWIQGCYHEDIASRVDEYWNYGQRNNRDDELDFTAYLWSIMSEEQHTILKGNEDSNPSPPFKYDIWIGQWTTGENTFTQGNETINILCEGKTYPVTDVPLPMQTSSFWWGTAWRTDTFVKEGTFYDYGIFTKKTIDREKPVKEQNVDPVVYCYCYASRDTDTKYVNAYYRVIMDGVQYTIDTYSISVQLQYNYPLFTHPDINGAQDSDKNTLHAMPKIRIGKVKLKTNLEVFPEVEYEKPPREIIRKN